MAARAAVPDNPKQKPVVCTRQKIVVVAARDPRHASAEQGLHHLRIQKPDLYLPRCCLPVEELPGVLAETRPRCSAPLSDNDAFHEN